MLPVSAAFLNAVRGSHSIASRVRVITPGDTGSNPGGRDLAIVEGTVTLDATADVRGSIDIVVKELWPNTNTVADLVPYGTEVAVSRGIVFGNGAVQRAPLGIYRLTNVEQADAPAGSLRLTGTDRMGAFISPEGDLEQPRSFGSSSSYGTVMSTLVLEILPQAVIEWQNTIKRDTMLGRTVVAEKDRYAFLNELVVGLGMIWYFDYRGVLIIKDVPNPTVPVYTVNAGAGGVLTSVSRSRSRDGVFNIVVATGEAIDNLSPAYAVARDDSDPLSVTNVNGAFGRRVLFINNPQWLVDADAQVAANAKLLLVKGLPYVVDFTMVPNPALEPLDAVELVYPLDITQNPHVKTEFHILDQLVIGLSPEAGMGAATRLTTNNGS